MRIDVESNSSRREKRKDLYVTGYSHLQQLTIISIEVIDTIAIAPIPVGRTVNLYQIRSGMMFLAYQIGISKNDTATIRHQAPIYAERERTVAKICEDLFCRLLSIGNEKSQSCQTDNGKD